jgi:hypothetical protein
MRIPKAIEIISVIFILLGPILLLYNGNKWIKNKPRRSPLSRFTEFLSPQENYRSEINKDVEELNKSLLEFYLNRTGWVILILGAVIQVISIITR